MIKTRSWKKLFCSYLKDELMMEKRLVIFLGSMGRGGAERVISLISNYFCDKGWKVWIGLLLFNKVEYELNPNIKVVDLTGKGQSRIKRLPVWLRNVRGLVKEVKPDAILSFAARINIIVQLACAGLKQNIVVSERNDPYMDGRSKLVDFFTSRLYPRANAVVFQTQRAAQYFAGVGLNNTVIIPNPISVTEVANKDKKNKIVTVGRLTKQKNQKMLINAFSKIIKEFPDYKLYIYGEGELREDLEQQIRDLQLTDKVILEGNVPNVHEMISDAQIFVLPSDYEGLSNALLEAMMMGLPCVSTDCAGSDEYIVDGYSGELVKTGDESGLTEAILKLIRSKELRETCENGAVEVSKQFTADSVLEKWYNILSEGVERNE